MIAADTYTRLYQIAESQAGFFMPAQARTADMDRSKLSRQVAVGRLRRVAPGVYRLARFPASRKSPFLELRIHSVYNSRLLVDNCA